ncbi:unnamed protein product [Closterium sp. Yama58-4]|nr:unnamed protein product [Closterium sp. Yama58-4]
MPVARAQQCSSSSPCNPRSLCCSKWGWCGSNVSYCGDGCQNGPCSGGTGSGSASFRRITYFPNWSGIDPSTIQVNHFTHIVYAFAAISPLNYTVVPSEWWTDVSGGLYTRFTSAIKAQNPAVKPILSIGGGDAVSAPRFSYVAATQARRTKFINSAIALARKYGFQGIDVDWETPKGVPERFSALIQDFRAAVDAEAARTGREKLTLSAAIPGKLVLGLESYGHAWTLQNAGNHKVGAPAKGGPTMSYKEIVTFIANASFRRITYFPNWSGIDPSTIQVNHFTHIVYAFAAISPLNYTVVPYEWWTDIYHGLYTRFTAAIKAKNPAVKSVLSIGGGDAVSAPRFSYVSATKARRTKFINSGIALARKYGFQGIDIDWELPKGVPGRFSALISDFRAAIDAEAARTRRAKLTLSAAVTGYAGEIDSCYQMPTLNKVLDWVGIMTYEFHGEWDDMTAQHTALEDKKNPLLSIKGAVAGFIAKGLSRSKLVLGLASYGHVWTLKSAANHGVGAPAKGGPTMSYKDIVKFIAGGATSAFDSPSSSMYAYKGTKWVGYDNPDTIAKKVREIKTKSVLVREGDTAWDISLRFGLTLDELLSLNASIPDPLYPGDELLLPADAVERPRALVALAGVKAKVKGTMRNANFWDVFPPPRNIDSYRKRYRVLLDAMRYVETSFIEPAPVGDDGLSIGPLQISNDYHTDAWWLEHRPPLCYEDCHWSVEHSERTVINYWLRYCPWSLEFHDHETLARTHNGGPGFYRYIKTATYWRKVKSAMRHAGWFRVMPEFDPHLSSTHLHPHAVVAVCHVSDVSALNPGEVGRAIDFIGKRPEYKAIFKFVDDYLKSLIPLTDLTVLLPANIALLRNYTKDQQTTILSYNTIATRYLFRNLTNMPAGTELDTLEGNMVTKRGPKSLPTVTFKGAAKLPSVLAVPNLWVGTDFTIQGTSTLLIPPELLTPEADSIRGAVRGTLRGTVGFALDGAGALLRPLVARP